MVGGDEERGRGDEPGGEGLDAGQDRGVAGDAASGGGDGLGQPPQVEGGTVLVVADVHVNHRRPRRLAVDGRLDQLRERGRSVDVGTLHRYERLVHVVVALAEVDRPGTLVRVRLGHRLAA